MFQFLGVAFSPDMIDVIMHYVLIGTIVLGAIFALILTVFVVKGLRYHHQMKHNKKEKAKLLKEFDNLEQDLEKQTKQA